MAKAGENVGNALGVDFTAFTEPISRSVDEVTVEDLLRISDQFLERGEPVVAVVFARSGVADDEAILGQGSELHRGAWVRWTDDVGRTALITLHELGHICDADHCGIESCLMFHTLRDHDIRRISLEGLFCSKCQAVVKGSWVYTRLTHSAEHRAQQGTILPRIANRRITSKTTGLPRQIPLEVPTSNSPADPYGNRPPFPSWDLAGSNSQEFIRQVKEHFGFSGR
jgi:hypothetical protein